MFEFKFREGPEVALAQIDDRNYSIAFGQEGKKTVRIGVGNCMAVASKGRGKGAGASAKPFEYRVVG